MTKIPFIHLFCYAFIQTIQSIFLKEKQRMKFKESHGIQFHCVHNQTHQGTESRFQFLWINPLDFTNPTHLYNDDFHFIFFMDLKASPRIQFPWFHNKTHNRMEFDIPIPSEIPSGIPKPNPPKSNNITTDFPLHFQ